MKLQYCSDLHLEFKENEDFIKTHPLQPVGDVLILAGDIVPFVHINKHKDFFDYVSDNFKRVYWIPGNHEYYGNVLNCDLYDLMIDYDSCLSVYKKIRENVFLVNNQVVKLGNIKFLFTSLWTKISLTNQWYIHQHLNDFHQIKFNGKTFTPEDYNKFHMVSREFLTKALLEKDDCKTVVITHHVPTLMNYPEEYKRSTLNEAFAVELYDFIDNSSINYWIYGHHHINTQDFKIGNTWLLTNQLGYMKYNENEEFNPERHVIIGDNIDNHNNKADFVQ